MNIGETPHAFDRITQSADSEHDITAVSAADFLDDGIALFSNGDIAENDEWSTRCVREDIAGEDRFGVACSREHIGLLVAPAEQRDLVALHQFAQAADDARDNDERDEDAQQGDDEHMDTREHGCRPEALDQGFFDIADFDRERGEINHVIEVADDALDGAEAIGKVHGQQANPSG